MVSRVVVSGDQCSGAGGRTPKLLSRATTRMLSALRTAPHRRARSTPSPQLVAAAERVAAGQTVVIIDDRTFGSAILVQSGQLASVAGVAFLIRHSSGFIRAALPATVCTALRLPLQTNEWPAHPPSEQQCVAVDAATSVTTGISATDRARTLRVLADADTSFNDLTRPGHIVPVRVSPRGASEAFTYAEGALHLTVMAHVRPAAAYVELVSVQRPCDIADSEEGRRFAGLHGLAVVTMSDIARDWEHRPDRSAAPIAGQTRGG